jgi:hypothetical protein
MIPNHVGQALHDRATRGEALSPDESARLSEWYDQMDGEEARSLTPTNPDALLDQLRAEVQSARARLSILHEEERKLRSATESLRLRGEELERQLAHKRAATAR